MRLVKLSCSAIWIAVTLASSSHGASAGQAPWGCEILLCAPQQNPTWHGIAYCVPPMKKLIAAMSLPGFSWPICPGSGVGKPGKEEFEPCEEGWKSFFSPDRTIMCQKSITAAEARRLLGQPGSSVGTGRYQLASGETLVATVTPSNRYEIKYHLEKPRKKRANPWYFDMKTADGTVKRMWFNLNQ